MITTCLLLPVVCGNHHNSLIVRVYNAEFFVTEVTIRIQVPRFVLLKHMCYRCQGSKGRGFRLNWRVPSGPTFLKYYEKNISALYEDNPILNALKNNWKKEVLVAACMSVFRVWLQKRHFQYLKVIEYFSMAVFWFQGRSWENSLMVFIIHSYQVWCSVQLMHTTS